MTKLMAIVLLLSSDSAAAGDISAVGSAIETESYRCEVTSPYAIRCRNIGRVCIDFRAKEKERSDTRLGCALENSPNYPCPPWDETLARIKENTGMTSTCTTFVFGGW